MKRMRVKKVKALLMMALASSTVYQGAGCFSFGVNSVLRSFDFCFLLNCNDGALGGLFDFCVPVNFTSFVGMNSGMAEEGTFLTDCPEDMP